MSPIITLGPLYAELNDERTWDLLRDAHLTGEDGSISKYTFVWQLDSRFWTLWGWETQFTVESHAACGEQINKMDPPTFAQAERAIAKNVRIQREAALDEFLEVAEEIKARMVQGLARMEEGL